MSELKCASAQLGVLLSAGPSSPNRFVTSIVCEKPRRRQKSAVSGKKKAKTRKKNLFLSPSSGQLGCTASCFSRLPS
ncbi:hypothetical protein EBZ37_10875 [bacterium]|nr:hypothetical protein [bacterium]